MFFACGKGKAMSYQAALAAFEDAVKLHADVINMSWGTVSEYYGDNPFSEAIAAADRAGAISPTVSKSAAKSECPAISESV